MQFVLRFLLVALGLTALAACGSTSNTFAPASELIERPATYSVSQTGPTTRILSVGTTDHALTLVGSDTHGDFTRFAGGAQRQVLMTDDATAALLLDGASSGGTLGAISTRPEAIGLVGEWHTNDGLEKVQGVFTNERTTCPDRLSRNGIEGCFQSGNGAVHIRKLVETKEPEPERAEGVALADLKRNASGDLHALRGKLRAVLHVGIICVGDDNAGRFEPGRGNALDAAIREQGAHF